MKRSSHGGGGGFVNTDPHWATFNLAFHRGASGIAMLHTGVFRLALPSFLDVSSEPCFASRMKWPSLNRSILPVVNLSPSWAKIASRSKV